MRQPLISVLAIHALWSVEAFFSFKALKCRYHGSQDLKNERLTSERRLLNEQLDSVGLRASRLISQFESEDFPQASWPFSDVDMARMDSSNDANFYDTPRFVTHIDDRAIESLTEYYREEFQTFLESNGKDKLDVLDLCSSWISHLPDDIPYGRVCGIGMNDEELKANEQLSDYAVKDLNVNPSLKGICDDNSFDVVCNVVSVDYLTKPREVFEEMHRVLRPGGMALISFSNRCFPTKAVSVWLREDEIGRLSIVGSYFNYSAKWSQIGAYDIKLPPLKTPPRPSFGDMLKEPSLGYAWATAASSVARTNAGDPMYMVKGVK